MSCTCTYAPHQHTQETAAAIQQACAAAGAELTPSVADLYAIILHVLEGGKAAADADAFTAECRQLVLPGVAGFTPGGQACVVWSNLSMRALSPPAHRQSVITSGSHLGTGTLRALTTWCREERAPSICAPPPPPLCFCPCRTLLLARAEEEEAEDEEEQPALGEGTARLVDVGSGLTEDDWNEIDNKDVGGGGGGCGGCEGRAHWCPTSGYWA